MPATAVMTRLLREDLKARGADNPPPRVMAFVEDAAAADAIANPMRNALWEEHRIGLVLPDGMEPTKTLQVRERTFPLLNALCAGAAIRRHACRRERSVRYSVAGMRSWDAKCQ